MSTWISISVAPVGDGEQPVVSEYGRRSAAAEDVSGAVGPPIGAPGNPGDLSNARSRHPPSLILDQPFHRPGCLMAPRLLEAFFSIESPSPKNGDIDDLQIVEILAQILEPPAL